MTLLNVKHVDKRFEDVQAVKDLTVQVPKATALGLYGRSGCGKTTALRIIAGLEQPDHGMIAIDDNTVSGNGKFIVPRERNVGMVFQDLALWPHMTAERQVAFVLKETRRTRAQRNARLDELFDRLRLQDRRRHKPGALSGGEAQRVALARALANDPKLLLLDEPFAHLDTTTRAAIIDWLRELKHNSLTLIMASHNAQDHIELCDNVLIMTESPYRPVQPTAIPLEKT